MACWTVYGEGSDDETSEHKLSLVGGFNQALLACIRHFGQYPTLVLKQTSDRRTKGTDGFDSRGRDMRVLLHTDVFNEFNDEDDEDDEDDDQLLKRFLLHRSFAGDSGSRAKREPGDFGCKCSRCRKAIEDGHKAIGFEHRRRHFIYHLGCLGVRVEV
jgi:hypothetical protein